MSKRIVVTGGCGFLGGHLVDKLIELGHSVTVIDNEWTGKYKNPKATYLKEDVCEFSGIVYEPEETDVYEESDVIFHLAAFARVRPSFDRPDYYLDNNINSTRTLLSILHNMKYKGKVIYISSSSVYGGVNYRVNSSSSEYDNLHPDSPYAISKMISEEICNMYRKLFNLDIITVRPFSIYGERMAKGTHGTVIQRFLDYYRKEGKLYINGDGSIRRDFTHVSDVVDGLIMLMNSDTDIAETTFNIGTGFPYSINEIADCFPCEKVYSKNKYVEDDITRANTYRLATLGWKPKYNVIEWLKEKIYGVETVSI